MAKEYVYGQNPASKNWPEGPQKTPVQDAVNDFFLSEFGMAAIFAAMGCALLIIYAAELQRLKAEAEAAKIAAIEAVPAAPQIIDL